MDFGENDSNFSETSWNDRANDKDDNDYSWQDHSESVAIFTEDDPNLHITTSGKFTTIQNSAYTYEYINGRFHSVVPNTDLFLQGARGSAASLGGAFIGLKGSKIGRDAFFKNKSAFNQSKKYSPGRTKIDRKSSGLIHHKNRKSLTTARIQAGFKQGLCDGTDGGFNPQFDVVGFPGIAGWIGGYGFAKAEIIVNAVKGLL